MIRLEIHGSLRPVRHYSCDCLLSGISHFPRVRLLGFHTGLQPPLLGGPRPLNPSVLLKDCFWHLALCFLLDGPRPTSRQARHKLHVCGNSMSEENTSGLYPDRQMARGSEEGVGWRGGETRLWEENVWNNPTWAGFWMAGSLYRKRPRELVTPHAHLKENNWKLETQDYILINGRAQTWTQVFCLPTQREKRIETPSGLETPRGFDQW